MPAWVRTNLALGSFGKVYTITGHQVSGTDPTLVVCVQYKAASATLTGITFNGTENLSRVGNVATNNDCFAELWVLAAPTVTTADVVITFSANTRMAGAAHTYSDVDQANPFRTAAAADANGTDATPTVDVVALAGEMVIDAMSQVSAGPDTISTFTGDFKRQDQASTGGGDDVRGGSQEIASAGATETMGYTMSGSDSWAIVAAPLQAPGGGPTLLELSDAINIGDTVVNNPVMVKSDAIGVSDVLSHTPDTIQSDGVSVADTLRLTVIAALQDAINVGDALSTPLVIQKIQDAVGIGDTLAFTVIMPPLSDGITIGDVVSNFAVIVKNLSDAITIGDTLQPFNVVQRITDPVGIGDAVTFNIVMPPLSDGVTVTDDLNITVIKNLQDSISVTDSAPVNKVIQQLIDAVGVTDSLVINVVAVLNDPVNVGDVNTFTVIVKFGDSITISDNVTNNELGEIASLGVMIKGRTPIITIRGKLDS